MSESSTHMHYVDLLLDFVKKTIPSDKHALIYVDQPDSLVKPPRTSQNYVPDLYYRFQDRLVIGEAKTFSDVDSHHSRMQYADYFDEASQFGGNASIVFSVPLAAKGTIKNIVRRIIGNHAGKVDVFFVTDLGMTEKL